MVAPQQEYEIQSNKPLALRQLFDKALQKRSELLSMAKRGEIFWRPCFGICPQEETLVLGCKSEFGKDVA